MSIKDRFNQPVFVKLDDLPPEQREKTERRLEAFRRARKGDKSLAIELGLVPNPAKKKDNA